MDYPAVSCTSGCLQLRTVVVVGWGGFTNVRFVQSGENGFVVEILQNVCECSETQIFLSL